MSQRSPRVASNRSKLENMEHGICTYSWFLLFLCGDVTYLECCCCLPELTVLFAHILLILPQHPPVLIPLLFHSWLSATSVCARTHTRARAHTHAFQQSETCCLSICTQQSQHARCEGPEGTCGVCCLSLSCCWGETGEPC